VYHDQPTASPTLPIDRSTGHYLNFVTAATGKGYATAGLIDGSTLFAAAGVMTSGAAVVIVLEF
jgi:hypothetical protein